MNANNTTRKAIAYLASFSIIGIMLLALSPFSIGEIFPLYGIVLIFAGLALSWLSSRNCDHLHLIKTSEKGGLLPRIKGAAIGSITGSTLSAIIYTAIFLIVEGSSNSLHEIKTIVFIGSTTGFLIGLIVGAIEMFEL